MLSKPSKKTEAEANPGAEVPAQGSGALGVGSTALQRVRQLRMSAERTSSRTAFPSFEPQAQGAALLCFWVAWALMAEFGMLPERYSFYFTLLFPAVALCAAFVAQLLVDFVRLLWLAPEMAGVTRGKLFSGADLSKALPLAVLCVIAVYVPVAKWAMVKAYPSEFEVSQRSGGPGEVLHFEWNEAPVWPQLGEVVHAMVWKDTRSRASLDSGMRGYLRSKKRYFSTAPQIAELVRQSSTPEQTLTGASTAAPLIALLSERRLANDFVDTNFKVFRTGMLDIDDFWEKACADGLEWVVGSELSFFSHRYMSTSQVVQRNFDLERRVADPFLRHWAAREFRLYRKKPGIGSCAGQAAGSWRE